MSFPSPPPWHATSTTDQFTPLQLRAQVYGLTSPAHIASRSFFIDPLRGPAPQPSFSSSSSSPHQDYFQVTITSIRRPPPLQRVHFRPCVAVYRPASKQQDSQLYVVDYAGLPPGQYSVDVFALYEERLHDDLTKRNESGKNGKTKKKKKHRHGRDIKEWQEEWREEDVALPWKGEMASGFLAWKNHCTALFAPIAGSPFTLVTADDTALFPLCIPYPRLLRVLSHNRNGRWQSHGRKDMSCSVRYRPLCLQRWSMETMPCTACHWSFQSLTAIGWLWIDAPPPFALAMCKI